MFWNTDEGSKSATLRGKLRTRVVNVMKSSIQDLKGASEVQDVELLMQGEQHINRLHVRHCRRLRGHLGQLFWWFRWRRVVVKGVRHTLMMTAKVNWGI